MFQKSSKTSWDRYQCPLDEWFGRHSIHHHHQSLNREGRWGTTDDFATSFLHFSLYSTALRDLPNSRPVHSLMLSSHLFLCPSCLLPPFTVPCKMVLARPDIALVVPVQRQGSWSLEVFESLGKMICHLRGLENLWKKLIIQLKLFETLWISTSVKRKTDQASDFLTEFENS